MNRQLISAALTALAMLGVTGCVAGENSTGADSASNAATGELSIDFATYNPLSLIVRDQGLLAEELGDEVEITWVQSAGSNKANELLRSGSIDVGSTAGSAALLARANGSPIKTIGIYSQPEWSALVVGSDSKIQSVADLKGTSIAATKGTDPYFFLLQALADADLQITDVEVQNLQHADGRAALDSNSVDAWAGLDPIMAAAEVETGARLLYRNVDFNTYGFLNATEEFLAERPEQARAVLRAYEEARAWAIDNPEETAELQAEVASIDLEVATKVITERSTLDVNGAPGPDQVAVLERIAPVIGSSGDVTGGQDAVDEALATLLDDEFGPWKDAQ